MGNKHSNQPASYPHWNLEFKESSAFTGQLVSVSVLLNQESSIKFQDAVANYIQAKAGDTISVVVKLTSNTPLYVRLDAMDKSTGSGAYLMKVISYHITFLTDY